MPTTSFRNLLYRTALPLLSPSPRGKMKHSFEGHDIDIPAYERILCKHHVLGASLLLCNDGQSAAVHTSVSEPPRQADASTMYRVASITKMATALVTLMLVDDSLFTLDTSAAALLPDCSTESALKDITVRQLLCHTSGLRDTSAYDRALREGATFHDVLHSESIYGSRPGETMSYCNFGFGLLGCILENMSGMSLKQLFRERLFEPLSMRATLDASTLDESLIMPISRVLPYRKGQQTTITPLGRNPLSAPDPLRHFGHTAGAMYTDCSSLAILLDLIAAEGVHQNKRILSADAIRQMTTQHSYTGPASAPTRRYGLGLVILDRPDISPRKLYGHQGFAYGCVDGAFFEEESGRKVIFLNGGCSEAREGRLGLCNKALLQWALQKEMPSWK